MASPKYQPPKREQSDKQLIDAQYTFSGEWLPSLDPARIGAENFKDLENLRYDNDGIEGVLGYSEINVTPLSTYTKIWNGFQFRSDRTQKTYVLVHVVNPATGQGRVYENRTDITSNGNFEATQLHSDLSVDLLGRFSDAPGGSLTYCNGEENRIYGGDEIRTGGFFLVADTAHTLPEDHTDRVNNILTDSNNTVTYAVAAKEIILIFSTRPLDAIQFAMSSYNAATATLSCEYFNGAWVSVSNPSDGTSSGGVTLVQDGVFSFDSTVSDAEPFHFEGLYMYAYRLTLAGAGATANIAYVTLSAPWQEMQDIWDGVYRQPIQFQFYNQSDLAYEDYTLHVNQSSTLDIPIGGVLDGMTTSDKIIIMFEERMSAIKMTMLGNLVNLLASSLTIKYWNGSAYAACPGVVDGTEDSGSTKSFNQTGLISWNPPLETAEHKQTLFGTTGYAYEITVDSLLTGTEGGAEELVIDICNGIPSQQIIRPFKFSGLFKNRVMLGNYESGKEGNRMDYTMRDAPEVFNGYDSSLGGVQSLYFGGMDGLQSAVSLFNRFGSQVFAIYLVCKNNETYVLDGDNPEDYVIYPVSYKVGCIAPLTMDTAEIGFEMAQDIQRNVAIWVSYSGPMMFDGAVLRPIKGLEDYFDPNSDYHVNFDEMDKARGWTDQTKKEYNLLLPMSSETTPNLWVIYDLQRRRWFKKNPGVIGKYPACGFRVATESGTQYIYLGLTTGQLMQNESGPTWDGKGITATISTGDFWPSDNIWHRTRIRYIMLVVKNITEDVSISVYHFKDTDEIGADAVVFRDDTITFLNTDDIEWAESTIIELNMSLANSNERLVKVMKPLNKLAWAHGFSFELTTETTLKGFKPIAWGIRWEYERHER